MPWIDETTTNELLYKQIALTLYIKYIISFISYNGIQRIKVCFGYLKQGIRFYLQNLQNVSLGTHSNNLLSVLQEIRFNLK